MRRLTREDARLRLRITLSLCKRSEKKVMGLVTDSVRDKMIEDILTSIMGTPYNEAVILAPSGVVTQGGHRAGYWGQDEPHPVPILERNNITFKS